MSLLRANRKYDSITDISLADLQALNIKALCIDADNTSGYDAKSVPLPGAEAWVKSMQEAGIPILLLSNAEPSRAHILADKLGIPVIGLAAKPLSHGYLLACLKFHLKPSSVAMVGDQLFTDILGANLVGMKSLYVYPFAKEQRSYLSFGLRRGLEKIIFAIQDKQDRKEGV